MTRDRLIVLAVAVVAFLVVGGFIIAKNVGGGGRPITISITVSGSSMKPDTPAAKQGDLVTMTITADKAEEVHLHGYDIQFVVPSAGGSATHTFTADKTGSFDMEIEQTATPLGKFVVAP